MGQSQSAIAPSAVTRGLSDLASVEVQLVFHFLSASELLRLARCSQQLRQQADSPFAWKYAVVSAAYSVTPAADEINAPSDWSALRLLRHARECRVVLRSPADGCSASQVTAFQGRLPRPPVSIFEIDAHPSPLGLELWQPLLEHPLLQNLCVLRLRSFHSMSRQARESMPALLTLLCTLPCLHTLSLMVFESFEAWQLPDLPSLTSLDILDWPESHRSVLSSVFRCPRLRSLHLYSPVHLQWKSLFAAPKLQATLEELTLEDLAVGDDLFRLPAKGSLSPLVDEMAELIMRQMDRLHTIRLVRCTGLEHLIAALHIAPALRHILVQPSHTGNSATQIDCMLQPVWLLVEQIRTAMPLVHLTIEADVATQKRLKRRPLFKLNPLDALGSRVSLQLIPDDYGRTFGVRVA